MRWTMTIIMLLWGRCGRCLAIRAVDYGAEAVEAGNVAVGVVVL